MRVMTDASSVTTAAVLGAVAGLSVAVPVGPVAVLIVREALVRGRSAGLAAAGGVASVDLAYAMVAVLLGTQVSRLLTGHEQWLRVGGAVVLGVVGVAGILRWWRTQHTAVVPVPQDEPAREVDGGVLRVWARFFVVTALNPATALIFATVATGLAGRLVAGTGTLVAFAVGAGGASLAWQSGLALAGAWAGGRLGPRWHEWSAPLGSALVVVLAAGMVLG